MESPDEKKPRRVRYKGTHPKVFKDKYKELQPTLYGEAIDKLLLQGRTPAGMHRSICVTEILDFLAIKSGQIGLDATLGYGGHSLEMLKCLAPDGHLFAIDVDPIELPKTTDRLLALGYDDTKLSIRKMNFSSIDLIVMESNPLDFILADLGVSSMQIDNPDRGFSYKLDGPLDLRLNPKTGKSAAVFLKNVSELELTKIFIENADEPNAALIAQSIVLRIKRGSDVSSTSHLRTIISDAMQNIVSTEKELAIKKTCQRIFQAIRIEINQEFEVLDKFLAKLPSSLAPGGRVAILTFHSGEDRRVKKSFQEYFAEGEYQLIAKEPIRASKEEINTNPRARSAKLRWAIKV